ncbi:MULTISPECIES: hypothetical protein [unclassified Novosphingobium]|uniref:hypothetical protein n=1 Tax=unclassified Novosphingobium TaxID=2644732 RepID=UPI000EE97FC5|nr:MULTISPECIES: hypothetical protein [unclassified Novosphingobium]HCF25610.1 hypothetical protein [Novosphingobium sp.]HQV04743.1 hypothetical protein [Novosphingobium sp.]
MVSPAAAGASQSERLGALAVLALAVGSGLIAFSLGQAPASYAPVNAGALMLTALVLLIPGERGSEILGNLVLLAAPISIAASLLIGPAMLGVQRWIELGGLSLHPGMLLVPALITVLAHRRDLPSLAATGLCSVLAWLQPDFATTMAVACGVLFATTGRVLAPIEHAARLITMTAMVLTAFKPDPLGPVAFVETALSDGFTIHPVLGLVMALALVLALVLPPWLLTRASAERHLAARGLTGAMIGFTLPSLLAAYPQPLVGYGASAILGYGLALAVLRFSR